MRARVGVDPRRAVEDFGYFCEHVLGLKLWKPQRKAAASRKFMVFVCASRRAGKSKLIEAYAVWVCFRAPGVRALIVSSSESSAKDRIEGIRALIAGSELARGSTTDESKTRIDFANRSTILSRAASPRAIRGLGENVKLLVVDEASLVSEEVWAAAVFASADCKRAGGRVIVADTAWGSVEHWWRKHHVLGEGRHPDIESFRWDYRTNPLLDREWMERQKDTLSWARFKSDVLAEWVDDEEQMFPHSLLMDATADFEPVAPDDVLGLVVVGGVDYGFQRDASALAVIAALPDLGLNDDEDRTRFIVCHTELYRPGRIEPIAFVRRVGATAQAEVPSGGDARFGHGEGSGFAYPYITSETNGVGQMPTAELSREAKGRRMKVYPLFQTAETRAVAFGRLRALMGDGRLVLPRDGELLRAFGALTAKITASGGHTIEAVSEGGTHADLAFAAAAATGPRVKNRRSGCLISRYGGEPWRIAREEASRISAIGEVVETGAGIRLPRRPFFADLAVGSAARIHRAGHESYLAGKSGHRHRIEEVVPT